MKDLIIADITRIFKKPTYRIVLLVCFCISIIFAIRAKINVWNGYTFVSGQADALNICGYILGITIYLSVYADEFTSNSMQCMIGHGVSRFRLLLAKFFDCVIVTVATYLIFYFFIMMLGLALAAGINLYELKFISGGIMVSALKALGYGTFSMIVLYWTKNVIMATFLDALLLFAGGMLLSLLDRIPFIKFYHMDRYIFDGMLSYANASLQLGRADAWLFIFLAIARISLFSIVVSFLLFRNRELDF